MGVRNGPLTFMKILVNAPTIVGGVCYDPSHLPQDAPDAIGQHLIEIGNATAFETKVVKPAVTKVKKSSAPPLAQASTKKTATTRKRKPKS